MTGSDPFRNSSELAAWAAEVLLSRGIDEVAGWRMLEYWVNVELYRAAQEGKAGPWRHLGNYEQPYVTDHPRPGAKTPTKWIDLVLAEPILTAPERVVWMELKDLGRNVDTVRKNAKGLGLDLAALWRLRPVETQQTWLDPPKHAIDRGRLGEWNTLAPGLQQARHLISQIVIVPTPESALISPDELETIWLSSFAVRAKVDHANVIAEIGRAATQKFAVHALVRDLPR